MSWLRSAINKAAEVGGKNIGPNLSRTVKNVAQHASHAVAGGAKLVQDRLVGRNLNNSKNAIRRLDEVSLNSQGAERVQALTRWLGALKEIGKGYKLPSVIEDGRNGDEILTTSSDELTSPRRGSMVLFYDFDGDDEPLNFREIFLHSHAIENIVSSMILNAPADEEVDLLLEVFGLCLVGGKELHIALISSIQDLAKAFSLYPKEAKIKEEDLLDFACGAVNGLKINAELERVEAEIASIMQVLSEKEDLAKSKEFGSKGEIEVIQLDVQLRNLLQRKKAIVSAGDSQAERIAKVEELHEYTKSLEQETLDADKRISECRNQKEEALKYRVSKAEEVNEIEKTVVEEVKMLEQKRDELEAKLKEVMASLAHATKRLTNIQEEREQFDEASTKLVSHLAVQEEYLVKSIASNNAAATVLGTWISFLDDTQKLQASCLDEQGKSVKDALDHLKDQFVFTATHTLSYQQEELGVLLKQLETCGQEIQEVESESAQSKEGTDVNLLRIKLQERFLETEGQVITKLRTIEILREEARSFGVFGIAGNSTGLEKKLMDAFESIDQERKRFEALPQPVPRVIKDPRLETVLGVSPSHLEKPMEHQSDEQEAFFSEEADEAHTTNLRHNGDDAQAETEGWEFDELEEELKREAVA